MTVYLSQGDYPEFYCEYCAPDDAGFWPCPEEVDSPVHCPGCGCLLDIGLTSEGVQYVLEAGEEEMRVEQHTIPKKGTAEEDETFSHYHGSEHKQIVLDWLEPLTYYNLDDADIKRLELILDRLE